MADSVACNPYSLLTNQHSKIVGGQFLHHDGVGGLVPLKHLHTSTYNDSLKTGKDEKRTRGIVLYVTNKKDSSLIKRKES